MDIENKSADDLGNETSSLARSANRASSDETSVSYIKPTIKELVRTQVCFPNIKLLVDKISTLKVSSATESSGLEAYRLYLTDREKSIQAVVRRRLHRWLTTFDVREGSYVVLKKYDLAKGKRLHGEGDVFYLAISDFYSIGGEQRSNPSTDVKSVSASAEEGLSSPLDQVSVIGEDDLEEVDLIRMECLLPGDSVAKVQQETTSKKASFSFNPTKAEPKKRKRQTAGLDLDPDLLSPDSKTPKLSETPSLEVTKSKGHNDTQERPSEHHFNNVRTRNMPLSREDFTQPRVSPETLPSPLQLSTLASVTGTNATRNKQVNILAMIEYVSGSTVKPTTAPLKRDVRIVDPSTDRRVTLSVFVDPVNFVPKKYDIILFRNLTTHDFSGGNLNVYPKKCKGKEWFILNPYNIEECDMKSMEVFRAKYLNRRAQGLK